MKGNQTMNTTNNEKLIMWTESDAFERSKLIDSLKGATTPIRDAMAHFVWDGENLVCSEQCPKDHWRNLYFYLSGYGDARFQECADATKHKPAGSLA
jgi:hypothetical protein